MLWLDVVGDDLVDGGVEQPAEEKHHQVGHEGVEEETCHAVELWQKAPNCLDVCR